MTRDEAIAKAFEGYGTTGSYKSGPRAFVDMAVAFGLLKVDEPKDIRAAVKQCMISYGSPD